jgi:hypothetical protein
LGYEYSDNLELERGGFRDDMRDAADREEVRDEEDDNKINDFASDTCNAYVFSYLT